MLENSLSELLLLHHIDFELFLFSFVSRYFFLKYLFIYLVALGLIYLFIFIFIFGCVGSSFLCEGFLQLRQAGATLHCGAWASSLSRPLLLRSTGSRRAGSVIVAHGPSCSAACGIFPEQGSNLGPLHWEHGDLATGPPGKFQNDEFYVM